MAEPMTEDEIRAVLAEAYESFAECEQGLIGGPPLTDEDRAAGMTEADLVCTVCAFNKKLVAALETVIEQRDKLFVESASDRR